MFYYHFINFDKNNAFFVIRGRKYKVIYLFVNDHFVIDNPSQFFLADSAFLVIPRTILQFAFLYRLKESSLCGTHVLSL